MGTAAFGYRQDSSWKCGSKIALFPLKTGGTIHLRDFEVTNFCRGMWDTINTKATGNEVGGSDRTGMPKERLIESSRALSTTINMGAPSKARFATSEIFIEFGTSKFGSLEFVVHAKKSIEGETSKVGGVLDDRRRIREVVEGGNRDARERTGSAGGDGGNRGGNETVEVSSSSSSSVTVSTKGEEGPEAEVPEVEETLVDAAVESSPRKRSNS